MVQFVCAFLDEAKYQVQASIFHLASRTRNISICTPSSHGFIVISDVYMSAEQQGVPIFIVRTRLEECRPMVGVENGMCRPLGRIVQGPTVVDKVGTKKMGILFQQCKLQQR